MFKIHARAAGCRILSSSSSFQHGQAGGGGSGSLPAGVVVEAGSEVRVPGLRAPMVANVRREGGGQEESTGGGAWAGGEAAECRQPGWWLPAAGPGPRTGV
jgi:hypothetical protein